VRQCFAAQAEHWASCARRLLLSQELTALGQAIGTQAKGLAPHVIASLPRSTFLASNHHKGEGEGDDEM